MYPLSVVRRRLSSSAVVRRRPSSVVVVRVVIVRPSVHTMHIEYRSLFIKRIKLIWGALGWITSLPCL